MHLYLHVESLPLFIFWITYLYSNLYSSPEKQTKLRDGGVFNRIINFAKPLRQLCLGIFWGTLGHQEWDLNLLVLFIRKTLVCVKMEKDLKSENKFKSWVSCLPEKNWAIMVLTVSVNSYYCFSSPLKIDIKIVKVSCLDIHNLFYYYFNAKWFQRKILRLNKFKKSLKIRFNTKERFLKWKN